MEIFRRNNVRFIAVNNGIDSENPDTLEFAPFINIMSEWYAKDISKKVKTGIKTKGMSGKPIVTEAPYGYVKDPDNKDCLLYTSCTVLCCADLLLDRLDDIEVFVGIHQHFSFPSMSSCSSP